METLLIVAKLLGFGGVFVEYVGAAIVMVLLCHSSECGWFGAIHDCGLGFSLATSYLGVKRCCFNGLRATMMTGPTAEPVCLH